MQIGEFLIGGDIYCMGRRAEERLRYVQYVCMYVCMYECGNEQDLSICMYEYLYVCNLRSPFCLQFIMALAGKIGYNICILNLAERGLTDDRLALALSTVPPQVHTYILQ